jgi:hypothetical protein
MKKICTSGLAFICMLVSASSFAQCSTPATGPGASWTFTGNAQGFLTNGFNWGSDKLTSTNVGAGTLKQLSSPILYLIPGATSIAWRFDLSGNANVDAYVIYAETFTSQNIAICSGSALANGTGKLFSAPVPAGLSSGTNFRLHIDFTISGGNGQSISLDNFGASPSQANGALPVRFVAFEALKKSTGLELTWTIHEEDKLKSYEIQRSSDGVVFQGIGTVAASNAGAYSFTDPGPLAGKSYYRIKSLDIDTRYGYSTVISVNGGKANVVFKVFPSIVQEQFTVQHDAATAATRIVVNTEDGRIVQNIIPSRGSQQTLIDLSSARPGLYLVRFEEGNGAVETLKIIKQ